MKVQGPDCNARTDDIRNCTSECDCVHWDEFCSDAGVCTVNQTIYDNYECTDSGCIKH
jgi:hypothetical protein